MKIEDLNAGVGGVGEAAPLKHFILKNAKGSPQPATSDLHEDDKTSNEEALLTEARIFSPAKSTNGKSTSL